MTKKSFHDPDATYKLWMHLHTDRKIVLFSYDLHNGKRVPEVGLTKLQVYIEKQRGKYHNAIIYRRSDNEKVSRYHEGVKTL